MSVAPAPITKASDAYRIDVNGSTLGDKERKNTIEDDEEKKEDSSSDYTTVNISDNSNSDNVSNAVNAQSKNGSSAYLATDSNNVNKGTQKYVASKNEVVTNMDTARGKILQTKAVENAVKPPHIHEEAYVPVSYARERIALMSEDMVKMKAAFQEKIFQLDDFYRQLEDDTKNYYKSFIHVLNEKATERIRQYKKLLANAMKVSAEEKKKQLIEIDGLKNERSLLNIAKAKLVEEMEAEAVALRKHEEMELKKAHEHELKLLDEEKQKYVQILSSDANKLSITQHEMKKAQAALKVEFSNMSEEYSKQIEELQKHIVSLQDLQVAEAKENNAQIQHQLELEKQNAQLKMDLQIEIQKSDFEMQNRQKASFSKSAQQEQDEEVKEGDVPVADKTDIIILQLKEKILEVKKEKKSSREKVKIWLADFEEKEGRPPSNDEKKVVGNLFSNAKSISSKLKSLQEELKKLQDEKKIKDYHEVISPNKSSNPVNNSNRKYDDNSTNIEAQLKMEDLEKKIRELQYENEDLKAYKKQSIENLEKLEQDQLAATKKSKEEAQSALASDDVDVIRKQLRESLDDHDKIKLVVTNLQQQILGLKSTIDANDLKLREKNNEIDELTTKYEELKVRKPPTGIETQAKVELSSSNTSKADDNKELLEQIRNMQNELEDQKFKVQQKESDMEALEEQTQDAKNLIKQLQLEVEKKNIELEIANAKGRSSVVSSDSSNTTTNVHSDEPNILQVIKQSVSKGKKMWKSGNKQGCYDEYLQTAEAVLKQFPDTKECEEFKTLFKKEIPNAKTKSAGPAAILLRKIFKAYQEDAGSRIKNPKTITASNKTDVSAEQTSMSNSANNMEVKSLEAKLAALENDKAIHASEVAAQSKSSSRFNGGNNTALNQRIKQLEDRSKAAEHRVKELESEMMDAAKHGTDNSRPGHQRNSGSNKNDQKVVKDLKTKVKTLEKQVKDDKVKLRQMENKLEKAEQAAARGSGGDSTGKAVLERRVKEMEKKHKKALDELETTLKRSITSLEKQVKKFNKENEELSDNLKKTTAERDALKTKVNSMGAMGKEMETLRAQAAEAKDAKKAASEAIKRQGELQDLYKEEMVLRKRYWNMMEDMKGKIRVYCRTRPLSHSELERGNYVCVKFPDEVTINVETNKGVKEFIFDQCFTPSSTQEEIFEDTSNLINSAFDGYNVCIFAYGQTGAGKSYTMLGALPDNKGITPRAIDRIFELKKDIGNKSTIKCKAYMAELYNDKLVDLLWMASHGKKDLGKEPKLSIKKDAKGMVFVKGIQIAEANSAEELMELFNTGNNARHVGATKMNAESSRSHLIFSIIIENHDHTTGKTNVGKLTLVDLAGSERVGKTGATKERLKEAQSINTSLSALGDVISALSTGAKFIPYRNNKLTMLLADGLGGNAKTLMFVNLSPADYNADETQTALVYASRVKMITNTAKKESDSEIVAHLKKIVDEYVTTGDSVTFKKLGLKPHEEEEGGEK